MENQIFKVVGTIIEAFPTQSGTSASGTNWAKKDVLIETIEKYPKKVSMTIWNDLIDLVKVNVKADIGFNIEAKEWNGKYYNNVTLRTIYYQETEPQKTETVPSSLDRETAKFGEIDKSFTQDTDDMPF